MFHRFSRDSLSIRSRGLFDTYQIILHRIKCIMYSKMKVLVCLTDPRFGGPQRASLKVAKRLASEGIESEFLIPRGEGNFATIARKDGFEIHNPGIRRLHNPQEVYKNFRYLTDSVSSIRAVQRIIDNRSIDIVNARTTMSFQAAAAAILSNTPLVWHFNDTVLPKPLANMASNAADKYAEEIVISADNVIDYYFQDGIDATKIYPIVDLAEFNTSIDWSSPHKIDNNNVISMGLVGNINPLKGYDTFIDAYSDVANEFPNTKSFIVGKKLSSQKKYHRRLQNKVIENNLENQVQFLGWKEDIPGFLSSIDLFVMPSHSETGPMTLMEAMAMKKPIVTTNVGVVPEELEDGKHAWIVEPKEPAQLASAIRTALSKRGQWGMMGEAARTRASKAFSVTAAAERYSSVYESAISSKNHKI